MICIKFYQIATVFVSAMDVDGIEKGLILLFLAFALLDGPNMVQKLTGIDAGMSDGMGKMMGMFYGSQIAGSIARTAGGIAKGAGGLLMKPFSGGSGGLGQQPGDVPEPPSGKRPDDTGSAGGGQDPSGGNERGEGNTPDGEKPDSSGVPERDNQNPDLNTESNSDLRQNGEADGSGMPDSDNSNPDVGMAEGSLSDGEIPDAREKTDGNMPENDVAGRTGYGHGSDSALSENDSQNPSGNYGAVSAGSGKEELLNGMDPATGSMAESLASSMENMEKDLGDSSIQGMAGNNSGLMSASPARHAGSMFSPERHPGRKQEIPHSDLSSDSASKAESQVERNMAFDNNDVNNDAGGGTP